MAVDIFIAYFNHYNFIILWFDIHSPTVHTDILAYLHLTTPKPHGWLFWWFKGRSLMTWRGQYISLIGRQETSTRSSA